MELEPSFTVLAESPYYFLSEEPDGYALWTVNGDETDDPVLTFPTGDAGRESAFVAFRRETRLGRWARFFLVVAFIAGPVWIVAEATQRILAMSRERSSHRTFSASRSQPSGGYARGSWRRVRSRARPSRSPSVSRS